MKEPTSVVIISKNQNGRIEHVKTVSLLDSDKEILNRIMMLINIAI